MAPGQLGRQGELALQECCADRLTRWAPAEWPVAEGWQDVVDAFFSSAAGMRLEAFIRERLASGAVILPPRPLRALELTPLAGVRAVILGQDPYHGPGQAEGLAFSVPPGVRVPPSLRNIFRELHGTAAGRPAHGSLAGWARQGVLLLNATLTVEQGVAGSHAAKGWEALTGALLARVAATASPCVYMLWGAHAQASASLISETALRAGRDYLLLQANHPSPLSANRPPVPFIGCGHFSQARAWLAARGQTLSF